MNPTNSGYSLKNIPIASKYDYLKPLTEKVESFIKRINSKAYFFDKPESREETNNDDENQKFGFKSTLTPAQHDLLINFENDMYPSLQLARRLSTSSN